MKILPLWPLRAILDFAGSGVKTAIRRTGSNRILWTTLRRAGRGRVSRGKAWPKAIYTGRSRDRGARRDGRGQRTGRRPGQSQCDPVDPISDVGWSVVPSLETVGTADGAPFQAGAGGDWFIERTTTLLPFCNYYNEIGIYSMRSYTLAPQVSKSASGSAAVPPRGAAGRSRPTRAMPSDVTCARRPGPTRSPMRSTSPARRFYRLLSAEGGIRAVLLKRRLDDACGSCWKTTRTSGR